VDMGNRVENGRCQPLRGPAEAILARCCSQVSMGVILGQGGSRAGQGYPNLREGLGRCKQQQRVVQPKEYGAALPKAALR